RELLLHVAQQIEAAASRHREIEDRHVPVDLARELQRLVAVGRFSDYSGRRIVRQHLLQAVAHYRMIVGYEDSHKCRFPSLLNGARNPASLTLKSIGDAQVRTPVATRNFFAAKSST